MAIDPWLPRGFSPKAGTVLQRCLLAEDRWQIYDTSNNGRVLVSEAGLAGQWLEDGLLTGAEQDDFAYGSQRYVLVLGGRGYRLEPVDDAETPDDFTDCQAFVAAVAETRKLLPDAGLHDAIYVERLSRLLPCYTPAPKTDDATLVGFWITGGVNVSILSTRRMRSLAPWLKARQLNQLAVALNLVEPEVEVTDEAVTESVPTQKQAGKSNAVEEQPLGEFSLPGRPLLEVFFNEHVIDLIRNEERYKALGIKFPGAVLLHGPPGCGKTFAVEKLVEHLDWPFFSIDSGSIGSPFIHETGKKIAEAFAQASKVAPAVVVIDEIDAYLAARDNVAGGQHRVEEVAEFLRSIPKAAEDRVLVIGMTNRLDSLDPAVVRRGRFDHILEVGMPSEIEVHSLLTAKLADIPTEGDIDIAAMAKALVGRPLSDVGFIIREACRLAAKSGASKVGPAHIKTALDASPSRVPTEAKPRKIGFI
ncbi:TPA: ATP-binding protein [Stenotrophomonas maltophilia]